MYKFEKEEVYKTWQDETLDYIYQQICRDELITTVILPIIFMHFPSRAHDYVIDLKKMSKALEKKDLFQIEKESNHKSRRFTCSMKTVLNSVCEVIFYM